MGTGLHENALGVIQNPLFAFTAGCDVHSETMCPDRSHTPLPFCRRHCPILRTHAGTAFPGLHPPPCCIDWSTVLDLALFCPLQSSPVQTCPVHPCPAHPISSETGPVTRPALLLSFGRFAEFWLWMVNVGWFCHPCCPIWTPLIPTPLEGFAPSVCVVRSCTFGLSTETETRLCSPI